MQMPEPTSPPTRVSACEVAASPRVRVSVAGASGYAGGELVRILANHPSVEIVHLAAGKQAGKRLDAVFPSLGNLAGVAAARLADRTLVESDFERLAAESDAVFVSLPHGLSLPAVPQLLEGGVRVVDLGGDFRLKDVDAFQQWYQLEHTAPELLAGAVYGMPELFREQIATAQLVANPGCYPTVATLALLPLAEAGLLSGTLVIVDAKSGPSGAGRKSDVAFSYAEINESATAYKPFAHRHQPEMEQNLRAAARQSGNDASTVVRFVPQLVPMTRGILATCYATVSAHQCQAIQQLYRDRYAKEPFVRFLENGAMPATKNVAGSNFAEVAVNADSETGLVVAIAAIDNLGKGAASAAVANFNLQWGFAETTGLSAVSLFP